MTSPRSALLNLSPRSQMQQLTKLRNLQPQRQNLPEMPSQVIFSVKKQDAARVSIKSYK